MVLYFFTRILFFLQIDYTVPERIIAVLLLIAEAHITLHVIGFLSYLFSDPQSKLYKKVILRRPYPSVAVVVAAKNEPIDILEQTIITLFSLDYPNKKLYLLDGSTDYDIQLKYFELCKKYNIELFHPLPIAKSKAEIINDFVNQCKEEYMAVFDADQNPMPTFLREVVSIIEFDKKIAFVQTPQLYSNIAVSPIAKGSAMQLSIFYESICEGKGKVNSMFCCGTNFIMRISILKKIGGFNPNSITEDFSTSLKIHTQKYKSVYYNHVGAFGMAPESLPAYFKQQGRWAAGTSSVFRELIKLLFTNPFALNIRQWWEYFLSSTYYFVGWSFFILYICPILFILFDFPSYFMEPIVYIASYVPYFVLTMVVFMNTMKQRNYKLTDIYLSSQLSSMIFPILMAATVKGLFGKKLKFAVTAKGKSDKMSFIKLWPWNLAIISGIIAVIVGVTKLSINVYAYGINILWIFYHIALLSYLYEYNSLPDLKKKNTNG